MLVKAMNHNYLHLAHFLSEWENHRTQEQFERAVVSKLVLFEFVNTFLALFYIAFYLQVRRSGWGSQIWAKYVFWREALITSMYSTVLV